MDIIISKRCWTEINLDTIKQNYLIYSKYLKQNQKIMAVVKADAYGHGDVEVAKMLQDIGCFDYAVSNVQEAVRIRKNHIQGQILILGYTPPNYLDDLYVHDLTQAILSDEYAELLMNNGAPIKCQVAIDTGMNRIGLDADNPQDCSRTIHKVASSHLKLNGIFTHLCIADTDDDECKRFTNEQIRKFRNVADEIKDLNLDYIHCLNTAGGLWNNCFGNLVRLGISLYGLKPDYSNVLPEGIEPGLSWKSIVSMVKNVYPGETIGYGRSFKVEQTMKVATVTVGYADGYSRLLSNRGFVLINGHRASIVGRVCMDQIMVNVTDIPDVKMGTEVTLIGRNGKEVITADDLAHIYGTIGYEVVCDISKRVERFFTY